MGTMCQGTTSGSCLCEVQGWYFYPAIQKELRLNLLFHRPNDWSTSTSSLSFFGEDTWGSNPDRYMSDVSNRDLAHRVLSLPSYVALLSIKG